MNFMQKSTRNLNIMRSMRALGKGPALTAVNPNLTSVPSRNVMQVFGSPSTHFGMSHMRNSLVLQQRAFSTGATNTFYAKDLVIEKAKEMKQKPADDFQYKFGGMFTDHMLVCDYDAELGGWQKPKIQPFDHLQLDPANATLHYSMECFEGAKAYKKEGDPSVVSMFRIDKNYERMNSSHRQLGFPEFDPKEMTECTR